MPYFGTRSMKHLKTCHNLLIVLFTEVINTMDCTVIEGHRSEERQNQLNSEGASRVRYPDGKHNPTPSEAVDVAPYINGSISWDLRHCLYFAGFVMGVAKQLQIKIRWGGDWDMDHEPVTDQEFQDLVHFELVE